MAEDHSIRREGEQKKAKNLKQKGGAPFVVANVGAVAAGWLEAGLEAYRTFDMEGADYLMVKPAGPYMDVIRAAREMGIATIAVGPLVAIASAAATVSPWFNSAVRSIATRLRPTASRKTPPAARSAEYRAVRTFWSVLR